MSIINVEKASIRTAAVEIKTLTVSGKQVTLSVFRQIKEKNIIDFNSMTLIGTPWGLVNYYFGEHKNCTNNNYFHIVWQNHDELNRCVLRKSLAESNYSSEYNYATKFDKKLFDAQYNLKCHTREDYGNQEWRKNNCLPTLEYSLRTAWGLSDQDKQRINERIALIKARITELEYEIEGLTESRDDELKKCGKLLKDFESLPHLFIAI